MVGNEVKRANDDDHGEFEGTTDRLRTERGKMRGERWSFDATVKVKTEANSGQQIPGKMFQFDPKLCFKL